ncbi:MAG TPA: deoxyguanosinetriphosphate triphosphohydrolase [Mycobacteriales bacterium]|nr:deoxyguanosinetriphosphate triphosphohydrolase [Mycobacteriales bacterium]
MTAVRSYTDADLARLVQEPAGSADRSPFERDRARVLHSGALRRLAGKTQVVEPGAAGLDWPGVVPRTRLTHSLECAQIGREIGLRLGSDPDLVDTACLAHDLGHPPFGHNGERALDELAGGCGGFEGNAQSLRVLTRLEVKVPGAGLNLTRAALDAATKYPWPRTAPDGSPRVKYGVYDDDLPVFGWLRDGAPDGRRSFESQVMDWADDVAYSVHDLEDGIAAGLVRLPDLRDPDERAALCDLARALYLPEPVADLAEVLDELLALPLWPADHTGTAADQAALKALTSGFIGRFCRAAQDATREQAGGGPLGRYDADLVVPDRARAECGLLKAVAARYVMSREGVVAAQQREREVVTELVHALCDRAPEGLDPARAQDWAAAPDDAARLRAVVDAVAGLTDAAAVALHRRLVVDGRLVRNAPSAARRGP